MYLATVDWAISMPNISSSPWILGARYVGRLIRLALLAPDIVESIVEGQA
jgi:hypothetical protein